MSPRPPSSARSALTARQRMILEFLIDYVRRYGYPPTMREIGTFFRIKSTNGVSDHLRALARKGYVGRADGQSRGLRILRAPDGRALKAGSPMPYPAPVDRDDDLLEVPVLGRVAAGVPLLAVQNVEQRLRIDPAMVGGQCEVFGLWVVGRSMIGAGIHDGDLVFVQPRPVVGNGRIAVAMIDGEATIKRFFREADGVRLQPENPDMAPIRVPADEAGSLEVIGEVVGVYRRLR